jgi:hypothetical protein
MEQNEYSEKPKIKPFFQNTLNPSGLEEVADKFMTGWTVRYNTVQAAVSKENEDYLNNREPEIRPFLQNTLNPSELEKHTEQFTTGWTVRYNTIQASVYKQD